MSQVPPVPRRVDRPDPRQCGSAFHDNRAGHHSPWVSLSVVRAIWRRFRQDGRALPKGTWQVWCRILAIGFVLTLIVSFGLTRLGQALQDRGLRTWDASTLQQVLTTGPLTFANAITWQAPGDLLFQPLFVLVFVALAAWWSRPLIAATMAASYILAFAFIWTGWGLWNRDRPNLIADGMAAPGLHSFPSGHLVLSVAIYGLVAYLWMRASRHWLERLLVLAIFLIVVALVGIARLALGSHWPSDILGGSAMGLAWLIATIVALRAAERIAERSPAQLQPD